MSQIPAGWYPDPAPREPGTAQGHRWWDGQQWTEHVHPGQPDVQPPEQQQPAQQPQSAAYPAGDGQEQPPPGGYPGQYAGHYGQQPAAYPGQYGQSAAEAQQASQQPAAYPGQYAPYPSAPAMSAYGTREAATPDGEPLSGWWRRVGAYVIDWFIRAIITGAIAFPAERHLATVAKAWLDQVMTAAQNNATPPGTATLTSQLASAELTVAAIALGVRLVYNVGFLKWKQATPGMFALGLRVRLRQRPGALSWGTVLKRWITQFWGVVAGFIPVFGTFIGWLWMIVDDLWPLWDDKRQALHDKAAGTNVVRVRRQR